MKKGFLPVTMEELSEMGIGQPDFVYVTGDAYVDHPSFGPAIISRVLEKHGFSVAMLPQPDWRDPESIARFGAPRLAFLVSAGNMDSMVNHYTVAKKKRRQDSYSPGGEAGLRPDRASLVYAGLIRRSYKNVPVILGGIEASLRRLSHYDYWSDSLMRSLLMDCGADLISYGMGERSIVEIAEALDSGIAARDITWIPGTCFRTADERFTEDAVLLPSYEAMREDSSLYAESFRVQYMNTDPFNGKRLAEPYGAHTWIIQNPPAAPLSREEMDEVYDLPYMRAAHPCYDERGGIPALREVKFSLVSNRGCFGGCNFCALTFHQGRIVQTRSHESLLREAEAMTKDPDFKGYIHDVGGPTANFRQPSCQKQLTRGVCRHRQCLTPEPCPNLKADHSDYTQLLRRLRAIPGVKKVFVRSGIRFDYVLADPDDTFLEELVRYHISGQLKVAPEHISDSVLRRLGKPRHSVFARFVQRYQEMNRRCGMDQYLVPYFMSSHPGCTLEDAVALAEYLRDTGHQPEQVQDFYPTPSTMSTCMYYTGLDPFTKEKVYIPRSPHEKAMQRALMQYRSPSSQNLVREALRLTGRTDLIGYGRECLVKPEGAADAGRQSRGGAGPAKGRAGTDSARDPRKRKTIRNVHRKKQEK